MLNTLKPVSVRMRNTSCNPTPRLATPGAAGYDVCAWLPEGPLTLYPGERTLVPTGLFLEMPQGTECQVRARSGLALKHGIGLVNAPGTIDSDYRGEVGILLINHGQEPFTLNSGDRVAQFVFARVLQVQFHETETLNDTDRGTGGFGHTGKSA
jgi:dUTP pyrophosphatase